MFRCHRVNRPPPPLTHPPHTGPLRTTCLLSCMTRWKNQVVQTAYVCISLFSVYTEATTFHSWTLYVFGAPTVIRFSRTSCFWRVGWGGKAGYVTSARVLVCFPSPCQRNPLNWFSGRYRCVDCFGGPMLCKSCIVNQHVLNPFHRLQVHQTFFVVTPR